MNQKLYRRLISFEVLSVEPIDASDLEEVHQAIHYGDATGGFLSNESTEVDQETMTRLLAGHNQPADFFSEEQ